jgi:hypothetical protein
MKGMSVIFEWVVLVISVPFGAAGAALHQTITRDSVRLQHRNASAGSLSKTGESGGTGQIALPPKAGIGLNLSSREAAGVQRT